MLQRGSDIARITPNLGVNLACSWRISRRRRVALDAHPHGEAYVPKEGGRLSQHRRYRRAGDLASFLLDRLAVQDHELEVDKMFRALVKLEGSDLHLKVGSPPMVRTKGELKPLNRGPIESEEMVRLLIPMMDSRNQKIFRQSPALARILRGGGRPDNEGPLLESLSARALWSIGTKQAMDALAAAIPELIQRLDSRAASDQVRAANILGAMGPRAAVAVPRLIKKLEAHDTEVFGAAVNALVEIGPDERFVMPILMRVFRRIPVGPALGDLTEPNLPVVLAALDSDDLIEQRAATQALASLANFYWASQSKRKKVVAKLTGALETGDEHAKVIIARTLEGVNPTGVVREDIQKHEPMLQANKR